MECVKGGVRRRLRSIEVVLKIVKHWRKHPERQSLEWS
jgi:hypothetical protein